MSPNTEAPRIVVPGRPETVDLSRVKGDTHSGIQWEMDLADLEKQASEYPDDAFTLSLLAFMRQGGRVFVTDADGYLYVKPENSELAFPE